MDDFISESTEVKKELLGRRFSVSLPSAAAWEEKMASFRSEPRRATSATVGTEVPLESYGEECSALEKLLRRCVRRCIRWYVEPLVQRQNQVNRALLGRIEELEAELRALKERETP